MHRDLTRMFKALGHKTRFEMFNYIRSADYDCSDQGGHDWCVPTTERTVCVSHISRRFNTIGTTAISQHLKVLYEAGLLERHKTGPWVYYTISQKSLSQLRAFFVKDKDSRSLSSRSQESESSDIKDAGTAQGTDHKLDKPGVSS